MCLSTSNPRVLRGSLSNSMRLSIGCSKSSTGKPWIAGSPLFCYPNCFFFRLDNSFHQNAHYCLLLSGRLHVIVCVRFCKNAKSIDSDIAHSNRSAPSTIAVPVLISSSPMCVDLLHEYVRSRRFTVLTRPQSVIPVPRLP
jgi:hypothetical protein